MYYRIKQSKLEIGSLQEILKINLEPEYKIYFKKGSKYKILQFIGRKDSVIIRKNSLRGVKMYLVQTSHYCDISIDGYIPSGILRNNPIPLGIWGILIPLTFKIDMDKFRLDILSVLDTNFNGKLRE
jgi:hypothetical protein